MTSFSVFALGLQVTQSKTSLEQALKLTKKLKKESASLREFVSTMNKELSKREMPTAAKDIEDELVWAKVKMSSFASICQIHFGCQTLSLSYLLENKCMYMLFSVRSK